MVAERGTAPRSRRTWPERLLLALGVVLVVGFAGTAVGVAYGAWRFGQVETYDIDLPDVAAGDPANFLIVGSDSRESHRRRRPQRRGVPRRRLGRAPLRHDPDRPRRPEEGSRRPCCRCPRDLWVPIAGQDGAQRINAAYAEGEQVLADTIQQYLGIPVQPLRRGRLQRVPADGVGGRRRARVLRAGDEGRELRASTSCTRAASPSTARARWPSPGRGTSSTCSTASTGATPPATSGGSPGSST